MKILLVISLLLCCVSAAVGQLVKIDVASGRRVLLPPKSSASTLVSYTAHSRGLTPALNNLKSRPPAVDVMECTAFSNPVQADRLFSLTDFPASTSVKLNIYKNSILTGQCTGHLVSPHFVLTAAHCLLDAKTRKVDGDKIVAVASFGRERRKEITASVAETAYALQSYAENMGTEDIMLLELADPIGEEAGWVGIGYAEDDQFFETNIFHQFSYPTGMSTIDATKDIALFYNYGLIDVLPNRSLGLCGSPSALAVAGQSGSSFLFRDEEHCYAVGVAVYAGQYQHYRINQNVFESFYPLITDDIAQANTIVYRLYPSPLVHTALLTTRTPLKKYNMIIYDSTGQTVRMMNGTDTHTIVIQRGDLNRGKYGFQLADELGGKAKGKFTVE